MPSPSRWWYGVAAFPAALLARFGTERFLALAATDGDPNVAAGVAAFALSVLAQWVGAL